MGIMHNKALWVTLMSGGATLTDAQALLRNEPEGLALDFTSDDRFAETGFYGDASIKDLTTSANNYNSSPTTSAASLLTYTSPSAKFVMGPSGTLRYSAMNLQPASGDLDNATYWTASRATAVDQGNGEFLIREDNTAANTHRIFAATAMTGAGGPRAFTVEMKASGRTWAHLGMNDSGGARRDVYFNLASAGTVGTAGTGAAGTITALSDSWYRCTMTITTSSTTNVQPYIGIAEADNDATFSGDNVSGILCRKVHVRLTPSDDTFLETTTAARYGIPFEWSSAGVLQGARNEEARTNLCLWNRDFTNAVWTKSNVTAAKTATGPDGVTNSASTLTATAGNGTVLQSITSASAARISSAYIKRRTGSGTIEMTQDNGTTWTAVTVTSGWTRVQIPSATVTNPIVGFRIVTSGDAIDVDLFQQTLGAFITSPIETFAATVTRAADIVSQATSAFPSVNAAVTMYAKVVSLATPNSTRILSLDDGTTNERHAISATSAVAAGAFTSDGGVGQSSVSRTATLAAGETTKVAYVATLNRANIAANGVAATEDTSVTMPTVTSLTIGHALGATVFNGYIQQVIILPRAMSDAEIVALTTL